MAFLGLGTFLRESNILQVRFATSPADSPSYRLACTGPVGQRQGLVALRHILDYPVI